jgi:hypothetical protein
MPESKTDTERTERSDAESAPGNGEPETHATRTGRAKEIGGPEGPEPTRYGDWERNGRCSDF